MTVVPKIDPAQRQGRSKLMRQLRINSALLAFTLAPLVWDLCGSLVTGGSFSNALKSNNLWILPFLIASGTAFCILNLRDARDVIGGHDWEIAIKAFGGVRNAMPEVEEKIRIIARRALPRGSDAIPAPDASQVADSHARQQRPPEETPETIDGLVADIWARPGGELQASAYKAAWRLAGLMTSANARTAIRELDFNADQLRQPYLKWLIRPEESPDERPDSLAVVQGRVGYLLRAGGINHLPAPPVVVDQYIAIGLIVVREGGAPYHGGCLFKPHPSSGGSDGKGVLKFLYEARSSESNSPDESDSSSGFDSYFHNLTYHDIGRLIRPDLLHTHPSVANEQADLIRHVMRHFLTDDLSAVLFDTLPDETQAHLARSLLTASKWMPPSAWKRWVKTGRNMVYAPKLELVSDVSFAAAGGMAVGILTLTCWEVAIWISAAWSWYFGTSHVLVTERGWFKLVVLIAAIVAGAMAVSRLYPLGAVLGVTAAFSIGLAILASPIVRMHSWIPSWAAASTVVVATLICAVLLTWLGFFYAHRRYTEAPIQLIGLKRSRIWRVERRSRYLPGHEVGHELWCVTEDA